MKKNLLNFRCNPISYVLNTIFQSAYIKQDIVKKGIILISVFLFSALWSHAQMTITPSGPTTFCEGGSVTLDAGSGYDTYSWNTGETTESITVTTSGDYAVTVTKVLPPLTDSASVIVTVNPNPTPTITPGGPTTFCDGDSVILNAGTYTSYLWSTGSTTDTIVALGSGTYTVTVTDANGCTGTTSQTVTVNPTPSITISTGGAVWAVCAGDSLRISVDPATTSYLWNTGATTQYIYATASDTFAVTVTNSYGCTAHISQYHNITVYPDPTPTITATGDSCTGGTVTLDAGSYSAYSWSTGDTTETITVTTDGTYTVTVTGDHGCTGTGTITVTFHSPPIPTITPGGPTTFCSGDSVVLDAGSGYSSYLWNIGPPVSPPDTTETFVVYSSGTYIVTVTDVNGCTGVDSVTVTVNPSPTPTITPSGPTIFCLGDSVTLDAGTYITYLWSTSETNETITVSISGNYTVTVTNEFGCTGTDSIKVTVSVPMPVIISAGGSCTGDTIILDAGFFSGYNWSTGDTTETITVTSTGIFYVTVTDAYGCTGTATVSDTFTFHTLPTPTITPGGSTTFCSGDSVVLDAGSGYSHYIWNIGPPVFPPDTTETLTVYTSGTYIVTVTDENGCTGSASIDITVHSPDPEITPSGPVAFCIGDSVILDAGTFISYIWSTGETTETITVSTSGIYTVTVTDEFGCTGTASIKIFVSNTTPVIISSGDSCSGGMVILDAGYFSDYIWSTGDTTETITVTSTGTYSVTVTDAIGCTGTASDSVTIHIPPSPVITPGGPTTFCSGDSVILDAGAGYVSYLWNFPPTGPDTTEILVVYVSGTYMVTVTDANGCTGTAFIKVTVYPSPTPTIGPPSLFPFCLGDSVNIFAMPVFAGYLWSTGATTQNVYVSVAGTYAVTVTNSYGCTGTASKTLFTYPKPTPVITATGDSCIGGSVNLDAGIFAFYLWSTGSTSETITTSVSGTYSVTVTDSNGCKGIASINLTFHTNPTPSLVLSTPATYCNDSVFIASGLWAAYAWSTGATDETIIATSSGIYTVTVTDSNGCKGIASTMITILPPPTPSISASGPTSLCHGDSVLLDAGGPYSSYHWSNGKTTEKITVKTSGTYTVSVTNSNGCQGTATQVVTVSTNPTPIVIPGGNLNICDGGSVNLDAGHGYSSYSWNNGKTTEVITVSSAGSYIVTVTNSAGCTGISDTIKVTANCDSLPCYICLPSFVPDTGKKYMVSVWVKEDIPPVTKASYDYPQVIITYDGVTDTAGPFIASGVIIDGWQRIESEFTIPVLATEIHLRLNCVSGTCYFDDIRVFPFDGSMKSYVYDPVTLKLVAELDERNYATIYEYDEEGKLIRLKKETERGIMTIKENKNSSVKKN